MTAKEIANKSWTLWNEYYHGGDLGQGSAKSSVDILLELESDINELIKSQS